MPEQKKTPEQQEIDTLAEGAAEIAQGVGTVAKGVHTLSGKIGSKILHLIAVAVLGSSGVTIWTSLRAGSERGAVVHDVNEIRATQSHIRGEILSRLQTLETTVSTGKSDRLKLDGEFHAHAFAQDKQMQSVTDAIKALGDKLDKRFDDSNARIDRILERRSVYTPSGTPLEVPAAAIIPDSGGT